MRASGRLFERRTALLHEAAARRSVGYDVGDRDL
jgi:hypothetical protein